MAVAANKTKPMYEGLRVTREEYLDLEDDGFRYEMIDGVLRMSPSGFFDHGELQAKFAGILREYLDKNPVGRLTLETDIFLPDGDDVLCPDISLVLSENAKIIQGHIHGTPDLVVEVLSKRTRKRDLGIKAQRYLKNGVKEYWIVDPENSTAQMWIARKDRWDKKSGGLLQSELLPGLAVETRLSSTSDPASLF